MLGLLAPTTIAFGQQAWPKRALASTASAFKSGREATIKRLQREYKLVTTGAKAALKRMKGKTLSQEEKKNLTGFGARAGSLITLLLITALAIGGTIWWKKRKKPESAEGVAFGPEEAPPGWQEAEQRQRAEEELQRLEQERLLARVGEERLRREKAARLAAGTEGSETETERVQRLRQEETERVAMLHQGEEERKQRLERERRAEVERQARVGEERLRREKEAIEGQEQQGQQFTEAELVADLPAGLEPGTVEKVIDKRLEIRKLNIELQNQPASTTFKLGSPERRAAREKIDRLTKAISDLELAVRNVVAGDLNQKARIEDAKEQERQAKERVAKQTAGQAPIPMEMTESWMGSEEEEAQRQQPSIGQQPTEPRTSPPARQQAPAIPEQRIEPRLTTSVLKGIGAGALERRRGLGEDDDDDEPEEDF